MNGNFSYAASPSSAPLASSTNYSGTISVSVRVKPLVYDAAPDSPLLLSTNNGSSSSACCMVEGQNIHTKDGIFSFDSVFERHSNRQVYSSAFEPLIEKVMEGYHGTVFAYGMTGSGKTHSMQGTERDPGIIPLAAKSIFSYIKENSHHRRYKVSLGYLEIYNEQLEDLIEPLTSRTNAEEIRLANDPVRGVKPIGLKEVVVNEEFELLRYISQGDSIRKTAGTDFNARSSRSHAVVQICIESDLIDGSGDTNNASKLVSTLYLCDLAGSERAVSQVERRKEGSFINKSLLTLGTIIARLSSGSPGMGHIPYRDSKLTRLLQPALSGTSLVCVLCTVQAIPSAQTETLNTLRFAARARNIVVSAKRNEGQGGTANPQVIERLMRQIEQQNAEILRLRSLAGSSGQNCVSSPSIGLGLRSNTATNPPQLTPPTGPSIHELEAENRILQERLEHLSQLCDDTQLDDILGLDSGPGDDIQAKMAQQIEEYKSYVAHLERQLYKQTLESSTSTGTAASSSPQLYGATNQQQHYQDMIQELREELEELREDNRDKDRIIEALRSSSKRKETLASIPQKYGWLNHESRKENLPTPLTEQSRHSNM